MKTSAHYMRNFCVLILGLFLFLAVFADFLANDKYILQVDKSAGWHFFPRENIENPKFSISPPIKYGPQQMDVEAISGIAPEIFSSTPKPHLLGSDLLGRDVFSGIIHGARTSLMIGLFSIFLSALIGIGIGAAAGYYGDGSLKLSKARTILQSFWIFFAFAYFYVLMEQILQMLGFVNTVEMVYGVLQSFLLFAFLLLLGNKIFSKLEKKMNWPKEAFPLDIYLSRLIELVSSLPILFMVIAFTAILRPSIWNVIVIIGFTAWTPIAKFTRSELLSIKKQEYITASRAVGLTESSILLKHALPNALPSILVSVIFTLAGAILAESTLSFLGVGLPPEKLSWGGLLSMARQEPAAWWLSVFPAFSIFAVIFSCNYLGRYYSRLPNS